MAITFKNYYASVTELDMDNLLSASTSNNEVLVLTGTSGSTIVKSLELINSNESCTAYIIRKNENDNVYSTIRVDLKANDYLILWQGFFVIPYNHKIYFSCNSLGCKIVTNVVEMT